MERKIVTGNELAKIYKVTVQTVRNWRLAGMPSHKHPGFHRRYDLDEISAWLTGKGESRPS